MIKHFVNWMNSLTNDLKLYDINQYLYESNKVHPVIEAFKIAILYGILGIVWIAFPDAIISRLTHDSVTFMLISIYKGWAYVALTVVLLFILTYSRLQLFRKALKHADDSLKKEKEIELKLHELAYYDPLTRLPNRSMFEVVLQELIAMKHGEKHAILYMDIDNFKNINDTFGHVVGDAFLKHFASLLQEYMVDNSFVSRLGGDEFAVIIKNINDREEVVEIIQKLLTEMKHPWYHENQEFYETVSIGVAIYPDHGDTLTSLQCHSDIAMYYIKKHAKNNFHFYSEELQEKNIKYITMVNDLHHAIENNEFVLYYQPILDLHTQELCGVEALIRWLHPEKGMIMPGEFIPVAEDCGLINQIGDWVMKTALYQKKQWEDNGFPHLKMSVNVSGRSLNQADFTHKIAALLDETNVICNEIQLEITETAVIKNLKSSVSILNEISAMGILIALDDFGTGYSSLTYLKNLPIDVVKLDSTFIKGIVKDGQDSVIVESVIQLTHDLDLQMIAEGIETENQMYLLKSKHCDYGQGYLFSKPVSQLALEAMMLQKAS